MSETLELRRSVPRSRRKTIFDAAPPRVQTKMFLGCGDLAGQRSLFDADVFDAPLAADWHGLDRRAEILRELVLRGVRVAIVERT